MPTRITMKSIMGLEPDTHDVQEDAEQVVYDVNDALQRKNRFVALTSTDGKQFSLVADEIAKMEDVDS